MWIRMGRGNRRWKCPICVNKTALSWVNRRRAEEREDARRTYFNRTIEAATELSSVERIPVSPTVF